jgi:hypothetical protein
MLFGNNGTPKVIEIKTGEIGRVIKIEDELVYVDFPDGARYCDRAGLQRVDPIKSHSKEK